MFCLNCRINKAFLNGFWMVFGKKDHSVAPWPMPCPSFLLQKASKAIAFFVRKVVKAFKLVALVFIQPLHSLKQHTGTVVAGTGSRSL